MAFRSGRSQSGRAYRWLVFLIAIMVVTAGAITAAVTAPPCPLAGLSFGFSSLIFVIALILAGRVTIALENARRRTLPPPPETNPFPIVSKLLRRK